MIEFVMNCPRYTRFLRQPFELSHAWERSISGAGNYADRVSERASLEQRMMTFAPSWMLSSRNEQRCSDIPKVGAI